MKNSRFCVGVLLLTLLCNRPSALVDGSNTEVSAERRLHDFLAHSKYPETNRLLASDEPSLEKVPLVAGDSSRSAAILGFTGEKLASGSLVVSFKVKVAEAGLFSFRTYLQSEAGRPLVQAMLTRELGPGEHTLDFLFYGKVIRDAGGTGHFVLPGITGEKMPDQSGRMGKLTFMQNGYRTKLYRTQDFTDRDWDSKEKRARIRELQQEIKAELRKNR